MPDALEHMYVRAAHRNPERLEQNSQIKSELTGMYVQVFSPLWPGDTDQLDAVGPPPGSQAD